MGLLQVKSYKGYLQIAPQGVPVPARVLKELLYRQQKRNYIQGRQWLGSNE